MEDNNTAVLEQEPISQPIEGANEPVATPAVVAAPPDPKDRSAVVRDAFDKANKRGRHAQYQARQEGGKFAAGSVQVPQQQADIPFPKSLKKDYEQYWGQTPAELRAALAERENAFNRGLEKLNEYKTQNEQAAEILKEFEPYQWILRNEQTTPAKAVSALLRTAAVLRTGTPAEKAQAVAQVMQQYQIPVHSITQMMGGQQVPQADPYVSQLMQEVQSLKAQREAELEQSRAQVQQRAMTVVEQFAAEPNHAHFDKVQDKMLGLLQSPGVLGLPEWASEREKLQAAYDAAIRLTPELMPTHATARTVQQVRSAAVQVAGSPSGGTQPLPVDVKDRRAIIKSAMSRFN